MYKIKLPAVPLGIKIQKNFFSEKNRGKSHKDIWLKRTNLDPWRKKGLFVGYSEQSKYYRIYILGYHQIELSKDVTFDGDITFRKSNKDKEDEEEHENTRDVEIPKSFENEEQV